MFCTSCGKQFDDRNRFCPYCGAQVPGALHPPAAPAQPQYQQPQYQQPQYQQPQYQQPQYQQPQYQQPQFQQPLYQQPVQTAPERQKKHTGLVVGLILGGIALILGVLAALITFAHLFGGWKGIFGSKAETAPSQAVASDPGSSPAESIPSFPVPPTEADTAPATMSPTPAMDETYDVIIWTGDAATQLTADQIIRFNRENTYGITFRASIYSVSESDAASELLYNNTTGADLYCFAQDQFARLLQAGFLSELPGDTAEAVRRENNPGSISAGTAGTSLYAYPMTADNGYFLYYDKSVIPDSDVDSLEQLLADCEASGRTFCFEQETSAWYMASFFFGAGCHSVWTTDLDGNFIGLDDDFNSDRGLIAVKGMEKLVKSPAYRSSSNITDFASYYDRAAVVVSGTWSYYDAQQILGSHLGIADLPSFEVDGRDYHLGSFSGCKLIGVKPQNNPDKEYALHLLAQYLTGEECQLERFNQIGWGPSNLAAQQSYEVQNNPALAALLQQNAYAVPQGQIEGSWWDIAKLIAEEVKYAQSDADLWAALQNYDNKLHFLFENHSNVLLFVGAWNAWNNADTDDTYYLYETADGVYRLTLFVPESDYMGGRIVYLGDWNTDIGFAQVTAGRELLLDLGEGNPDNNIIFAQPGTYTITWDGFQITITKN